MKKQYLSQVITGLLILLGAYSVSLGSETVRGVKKDYEVFKNEMAQKIESLEKQISDFKDKTKGQSGQVKKKTVAELEEARDSVKSQFRKLSDESKDSWANVKKSLAESVEDLHSKVQKALKDEN